MKKTFRKGSACSITEFEILHCLNGVRYISRKDYPLSFLRNVKIGKENEK